MTAMITIFQSLTSAANFTQATPTQTITTATLTTPLAKALPTPVSSTTPLHSLASRAVQLYKFVRDPESPEACYFQVILLVIFAVMTAMGVIVLLAEIADFSSEPNYWSDREWQTSDRKNQKARVSVVGVEDKTWDSSMYCASPGCSKPQCKV